MPQLYSVLPAHYSHTYLSSLVGLFTTKWMSGTRIWGSNLKYQQENGLTLWCYMLPLPTFLSLTPICCSFVTILWTSLKNKEKVITKLQIAYCTCHHSRVSSTKYFHVLQVPYLLQKLMEENIILEKSWPVWEFFCWTFRGSRESLAILPSPWDSFHSSNVCAHWYLKHSKKKMHDEQ